MLVERNAHQTHGGLPVVAIIESVLCVVFESALEADFHWPSIFARRFQPFPKRVLSIVNDNTQSCRDDGKTFKRWSDGVYATMGTHGMPSQCDEGGEQ